MSLWTPSGEHPVGEARQERPSEEAPVPPTVDAGRGAGAPDGLEGDVDELRRQLAEAAAEVVVANHCYGLFELAAVYLSSAPPHLDDARLAIDALGLVVDGLGERLGEAHRSLCDALAQLRLAYVQIAAADEEAAKQAGTGDGAGPA